MIVLDASAALEYLLRTSLGERLRPRILQPGETLHVPHLIDLEIASALRRRLQRRELSEPAARATLSALDEFDLTRYPHAQLLGRIWQLRSILTVYDAAYVALAEALGASLITTDAALARSTGHRARIESYSA